MTLNQVKLHIHEADRISQLSELCDSLSELFDEGVVFSEDEWEEIQFNMELRKCQIILMN
jgi:hypothetical protein